MMHRKLSFIDKRDPVGHIHLKIFRILLPFTHFLHNIVKLTPPQVILKQQRIIPIEDPDKRDHTS